ncbi:hypothetical protein GALMADRAFT_565238 [Galerina marginata CBS 339.88]|uniref:CUB domain-containing protein n=1 Tax=Galerina marginata (strain CBS 339.88) TaxID=685588 RepID=A0A067SXS2_GALM3|nr:hypothetical protein GALMADRAFT_565238 [Galerina marginata CBS 339.88]
MAFNYRFTVCTLFYLFFRCAAALENVTVGATDASIFYYTKIDWNSAACGKETCARGAFASFTFTGVAIYVSLFPLHPRPGEISPVTVNLDGTNSYMAPGLPDFPSGDSCLYTWFSQEGLENAEHSIKLTYEVGPQDPAAAKGCIGISRFIYTTDDSTPVITLSTKAGTSTTDGVANTRTAASGGQPSVTPKSSTSSSMTRTQHVLATIFGVVLGVIGIAVR